MGSNVVTSKNVRPEITMVFDCESYFDTVEYSLVGMYNRFRIKSDNEIHVPFAVGFALVDHDNSICTDYNSFFWLELYQ